MAKSGNSERQRIIDDYKARIDALPKVMSPERLSEATSALAVEATNILAILNSRKPLAPLKPKPVDWKEENKKAASVAADTPNGLSQLSWVPGFLGLKIILAFTSGTPSDTGDAPADIGQSIEAVAIAGGVGSGVGVEGAKALSGPSGAEVASSSEEYVTLYRGVSNQHAKYAEALEGVAEPRGGAASVFEHAMEGNTRSQWTSWTESPSVASDFALNNANKGVVLRQTFLRSRLVPSPNRFGEAEWLVSGRVHGAETAIVTPARPLPQF